MAKSVLWPRLVKISHNMHWKPSLIFAFEVSGNFIWNVFLISNNVTSHGFSSCDWIKSMKSSTKQLILYSLMLFLFVKCEIERPCIPFVLGQSVSPLTKGTSKMSMGTFEEASRQAYPKPSKILEIRGTLWLKQHKTFKRNLVFCRILSNIFFYFTPSLWSCPR